ncbi:MAG: hypothetical protein VKM98_09870 [Cyanobacteriota bacterium]|nr:hypothetical protein [Cyanobacteriota bacterium]
MNRSKPAKSRRVFQQRKPPVRWKQVGGGVLLIALGCGLLIGLLQLPERLDTVLLVSTAIANLIGGLGRFVVGLLQLLAVLVLVSVAIGSLLLLVAGCLRLVRGCLRPSGSATVRRRP